jgi:hypothetical protein
VGQCRDRKARAVTDLEAATRQAIATLRMRYRVEQIPAADDEALAAIMKAAGVTGGETEPAPFSDEQWHQLAERGNGFARLATEVIGTFTEGKDGHWRAHVGAGRVEEWRERLGGQE